MTKHDKRVALFHEVVERAGNLLSNQGCSDIDLTEFGFTEQEADELDFQVCAWNGDPEEHESGPHNLYGTDWVLLYFLSEQLVPKKGSPDD